MTHILIILFGVTMLLVSTSSRIEAYIKALGVQGFILFLLVMIESGRLTAANLAFLVAETLAFKTVLIPWFLTRIVRRSGVHRDVEPSIPNFYSLVITSAIFAFGFYLSYGSIQAGSGVKPLYFGISFSAMITGLFIIMTRKRSSRTSWAT